MGFLLRLFRRGGGVRYISVCTVGRGRRASLSFMKYLINGQLLFGRRRRHRRRRV